MIEYLHFYEQSTMQRRYRVRHFYLFKNDILNRANGFSNRNCYLIFSRV